MLKYSFQMHSHSEIISEDGKGTLFTDIFQVTLNPEVITAIQEMTETQDLLEDREEEDCNDRLNNLTHFNTERDDIYKTAAILALDDQLERKKA